ncbi:hypothetical protein ACN38_g13175, partial [Penicillium nordicum]
IITAQIVEIAGFVILKKERVLNISRGTHTIQYRQISISYKPGFVPIKIKSKINPAIAETEVVKTTKEKSSA